MILDLKNLDLSKINKENVKIDVGLSIDGPHSAHWLLTEENPFIIGFEPNPKNISIMTEGRSVPEADFPYLVLNDNTIRVKGITSKTYDPNQFFLVSGAIDDVGLTPVKSKFYCTGDLNTGCSSLLKPTEALGIDVEAEIDVDVYSLEYVLDQLGLQDLESIKFVKTDTQGKDFGVVKSLGKYLHKTVALKCEYNVRNQYENPFIHAEFFDFMIKNGFTMVQNDGYDAYFLNYRFPSNPQTVFNLPRGV
jgi:hypothetical protein